MSDAVTFSIHRDMNDFVTHIVCFCSEEQIESANERRTEVVEVTDASGEAKATRVGVMLVES